MWIKRILTGAWQMSTPPSLVLASATASRYELVAPFLPEISANNQQPLGGFLARMIVGSREYVTGKYKLQKLKEVREIFQARQGQMVTDVFQIENFVAEAVQINVPFNNPITGFCAFTHKAGIHAKVCFPSWRACERR